MRIKLLTLVLVIAGLSISSVEQVHANESLEALARQAVSEDLRERSSAITALREMGPAGLRVLFEVHAGEPFDNRRQLADDLGDVAGEFAGPSAERAIAAVDNDHLLGL